jgi:ABC-type Fe3+-hydroxamate transport system substrate-binding protein
MTTRSFSDQMGHTLALKIPPRRIISLVPSQTELLADLGLDEQVVGITKFCVHPADWLKYKTIIGGTKNFWFEQIEQLGPDLIIGNKEENYKEGIEKLRESYPVWMSDISTIDDALEMISSLGEITSTQRASEGIVTGIRSKFENAKQHHGQSVLYLIWRNPWMTVGGDTFIHEMLSIIGLRNATAMKTRYPKISEEEIKSLNADYIFLSSEPFPFREQHVKEIQQISPSAKVLLVDGEMFSWYGSRLVQAPDYFNTLQLD